jgi:hypothetical protein
MKKDDAKLRLSAQTGWSPTPSHAVGKIASERPPRPLPSMDASRYFLGVASTPPLQGVHYVEKRPSLGIGSK